ncbi:MAG TPA: FAD binding domain-containing protein [archaeon]|nr:FAD binding domain-containing protein [archaeon]
MRRFDMFVPENMKELLQFLDTPQSGVHLIANGTDLINRIQRKQVNPKVLVDLTGLHELKYVRNQDGSIRIGALTTISELITSPLIDSRYEVMREVASRFGGPSIINMATVGGNICSASSSEDLLPVLLVLKAEVQLRSIHMERTALVEDFVTGKRKTGLKANEILVETRFPELDTDSACSFEKVGMRNSLIIAFVNCAVYLRMEKGVVEDVRIAFNRVSGKIPQRARDTENRLKGEKLSEQSLTDATATLRGELKLSSDFRVSEEYRVDVASAIFKRALRRCVEKLSGERILV